MTESTLDLPTIFEQQNHTRENYDALMRAAFSTRESTHRFHELLTEKQSQASSNGSAALLAGVCQLMLGKPHQAISLIEKAQDGGEKYYRLGVAYRETQRYGDAAKMFDRAADAGVDKIECKCNAAECYLLSGELAEAKSLLSSIASSASESAHWHFVTGRIRFEDGEREGAIESYEKALSLDADHAGANFHLGNLLHLYGDDAGAREFLSKAAESGICRANALMNLAIVLEDEGKFKRAAGCVRRVLAIDPTNERAKLFLRDLEAAHDMFIDEQELLDNRKRDAVLDIPVSDFELSVRSRNCLKKMNIHTLGDLLRTTETELLAYKNFGETSLKEIKAMLTQKGLSLGQLAHERRPGMTPLSSSGFSAPAAAAPSIPGVNPELLTRSVASLELSVRSRKCLQVQGISSVGELTQRSEAELMASRNFGQTSLNEIKSCLIELGLSLKDSE